MFQRTLCVLTLTISLAGSLAADSGPAPTATAYTSTYGVQYARVLFESLELDIHTPNTPGPHPVILWLHTGAWISGDRAEGHALRQASRGYAVVSIDYRLAPLWIFPAQLEDCKAAIRWIRANAARYNFDPDRVGVFGASAGGHLGSLLGTTGGVTSLEGSYLGNPLRSSRVRAVVDFYGPTDLLQIEEQKLPCYPVDGNDPYMPPSLLIGCPIQECPERTARANPIEYLTPDDPPFLILQGTADCLVPWQQSQLLYDAMSARGMTVEYHLIPGGEHGGAKFHDAKFHGVVDQFLDRYLRGTPQRTRTRSR